MNMIKWYSKALPKLSKEQSIRLMDACVLQNGGVDNTAVNQWVKDCVVGQQSCFRKPAAELAQAFLQLGEKKVRKQIKSGSAVTEVTDPNSTIVMNYQEPGVWQA